MNPLTNARNQQELSERELEWGLANSKQSWHSLHKNSAYVYVGGLPYDLSEGDIICVFSQYGEIVDINLIRDKATGKSKGFCFLAYEDQRSTILAVDNLNTTRICNRQIRVQHVSDYKATELKEKDLNDEEKNGWLKLQVEGVAPKPIASGNGDSSDSEIIANKSEVKKKKSKKEKKAKKEAKLKKHKDKDFESTKLGSYNNGIKTEVKKEQIAKNELEVKRDKRERSSEGYKDKYQYNRASRRDYEPNEKKRLKRARERSRSR